MIDSVIDIDIDNGDEPPSETDTKTQSMQLQPSTDSAEDGQDRMAATPKAQLGKFDISPRASNVEEEGLSKADHAMLRGSFMNFPLVPVEDSNRVSLRGALFMCIRKSCTVIFWSLN